MIAFDANDFSEGPKGGLAGGPFIFEVVWVIAGIALLAGRLDFCSYVVKDLAPGATNSAMLGNNKAGGELVANSNAFVREQVSYHVAVLTIVLCRTCELLPCGQQGGNS